MKILLVTAIIVLNLIFASFRHQVVFETGENVVGRVVEIKKDSVYFQYQDQETEISISLKSILYIHNGEGKFFYISKKLKDFLKKSGRHGGIIVTINRQNIPYSTLSDELFMYNPRVTFYTDDKKEKGYVELEQIHKIIIDHTVSRDAAWRGFYSGVAFSTLSFILSFKSVKQFSDLDKVSANSSDSFPGLVTITPLFTFGWIVYDFFWGERELVLNDQSVN